MVLNNKKDTAMFDKKYIFNCKYCGVKTYSQTPISICLNCMNTDKPNAIAIMSMHGVIVADKTDGTIIDLHLYNNKEIAKREYIQDIVRINVYDLKRRISDGEFLNIKTIEDLMYLDIIYTAFWFVEGFYDINNMLYNN